MKKINLAGCVILSGNAILLLHRIKTDWYELPGGKIDSGETPEDAAKRELKEELLCEVTIIRLLGTKDFEENGYTMGYNWFLAKIEEGQTPKIGEPEKFSEYAAIPLKDLPNYKLSTNMQNFLQALTNKEVQLPVKL